MNADLKVVRAADDHRRKGDRGSMRRDLGVATVLALCCFALHLMLAWQLERRGAFERRDLLFDADISSRLAALSDGHHLGLKHPNLMPYFTPAIIVAAKIVLAVRPASGPEAELRRRLGVAVVPLAAGLTAAVVLFVFRRLGFDILQATIATLLGSVSFAAMIFGTIAESYGLSALALALAYLHAARSGTDLTWRGIAIWLAIGAFATGITLTNIVPIALLIWATTWDGRARLSPATTMRAAAVAVAALAITGVSAYVLDAALGSGVARNRPARSERVFARVAGSLSHEVRYLRPDPLDEIARFPTAVANSFAPPAVAWVDLGQKSPEEYGFTLERLPNVFGLADPLGLSLFLLLAGGAACALVAPSTRRLAAASIGILIFAALLSIWGREKHLYSMHWLLAAVLLVAGTMKAGAAGRWLTAALGVLTIVVAVNSLRLLGDIFSVLDAAP